MAEPSSVPPDSPALDSRGIGGVPVGTITVELTHRCHRRCSFCYVSGLERHNAANVVELSPLKLAQVLEKVFAATGCRRVQLSGGEPLLRKDLVRVLEVLQGIGADLSMLSEGAALDERLAHSLVQRGVGVFQPTLLAGQADKHDALRGAGAFQATTRAIATAAAAGLKVIVCMVITKLNWQESSRVAELAFALGARSLALSRFCPAGAAAAADHALRPSAEQVRQSAQAAAKTCQSLGFPLAAAVTIPPCVWDNPAKPPLRVGVCSLVGPRTTITLGPDGTLRSCSLSTTTVGNALVDSWSVLASRLWESQLKPFRSTIPRACRECPHYHRCLGGCRLSAQTVFGSLDYPDPLSPLAVV